MKSISTDVLTAATVFLLAIFPAGAVQIPDLSMDSSSRLWIEGESTLHSYASRATQISVTVSIAPRTRALSGPGSLRAAVLSGMVAGAVLDIPVIGLKSGEEKLDRNMAKALNGEQYPEIQFTMTRYAILSSSVPDQAILSVDGTLSIAGKERRVEIRPKAEFIGNTVRIIGSHEILMSDYGVKPPTLMFGAIRVADPVNIGFNLLLREPVKALKI
ncbi:MAG: YceI family protein [Elusimicrobiota bacterium]